MSLGATFTNDYKVGKGLVFFDKFSTGTTNTTGEVFLGDVKTLNVSIKSTQLDHYQSTGGIKIIDASATIQADASGQLVTENVDKDNVARFFFGSSSTVTTAAGTVTAETVGPVLAGAYYQLGVSSTDPLGVQRLDEATPAVVKDNTGTTTYVAGTDYYIDYTYGRVQILSGGAITAGSTIKVTYTTLAKSKPRVISGTTPIEGALRYTSQNITGSDQVIYMPYVKLIPNGTYELIGDKFSELTFDLKVMKKPGKAFVYADGLAA